MADEQVEILIKTTADQAGTQQTVQGLNQVKAAGTEAPKEIGKETKKLTGLKHELKAALHALGAEFPEVGHLSRFLFNPITAGFGVAMILIRHTKEGIKQLLETAGVTAAWDTMTGALDKNKEALENATLEAEKYERQLGRIATAIGTVEQRSQDLIKVHQAQTTAEDKLDEARKKVEISQVEATESNPVKRSKKLLEIEERYAARKKKREDDSAIFEMGQRVRAIEGTRVEAENLDAQIKVARTKRDSLESEGLIKDKIEVETQRFKSQQDLITKLEDRKEAIENTSWATRSTPEQQELIGINKRLPEEYETLDRQRAFLKNMKGRAPGQINQWRAADESVSALEGQRTGAQQRLNQMGRELDTADQITATQFRERHESSGLGSLNRLYEAQAKANEEAGRAGKSIVEEIRRGAMILPEIEQTFKENTDLVLELRKEIHQIKQRLKLYPPSN